MKWPWRRRSGEVAEAIRDAVDSERAARSQTQAVNRAARRARVAVARANRYLDELEQSFLPGEEVPR